LVIARSGIRIGRHRLAGADPLVHHCTIPGFLLLLGEWGRVPAWLVLVAIAAALLPIASRTLRAAPDPADQAGAGVPVSVP